MSAWGPGLFSDDTTCDVRDGYMANLKAGMTDAEAVDNLLRAYSDVIGDAEVACLVYFALADTQWRVGRLDAHIKEQALELLRKGGDVHLWEQDAPDEAAARKRVLADLRKRLEGEAKPRRSIRVEPPTELRKRTDAAQGTVFLLPLSSGDLAALVLVGHCDTGYRTMEPVFGVLHWRGESPPAAMKLLQEPTYVAIEGDLGPTTEIGFLAKDARVNPICDFVRTEWVVPKAPSYSGGGTFTDKETMIARIEGALS